MRKHIVLTTLIILTFVAYSYGEKAKSDSVTIYINENLIFQITARNFFEINKHGNIDSIYALFLSDLKNFESELKTGNKINSLQYDLTGEYRKLRIKNSADVQNEVSIGQNGKVMYFQEVTFIYPNGDEYDFKSAGSKGYKEFSNLKLDELVKKADEDISPKGNGHRKLVNARYKYENETLVRHGDNDCFAHGDIIELDFDIGLGTVKTTLVPDISLGIMTGLSKKGKDYLSFGLSYEYMFLFEQDPEGNDKIKNDGFLNALFGIENMGVKFGVLVDQNSNAFKDETYRFALYRYWKIGIESGIYYTDYGREVYPYVRLFKTW